jgi:hypothetical protein
MLLSKKDWKDITGFQNSLITDRNLKVVVYEQGMSIENSQKMLKQLPLNLMNYAQNLTI